MDIKLYDANFETTGKVIDTFSSLSYTDRWNADGDFKLVLPVSEYNTVKDAKYVSVDGRTFEVSQINTADTSASDELTIAGHNLNVLLDRVVIDTPARIQGNLETQIRALVSGYAITGWQSVPRLVLGDLRGYARAIDANATRGSLGVFLYTELNKRGFSFELNYDPAADEITFDIIQSKDRTEDQTDNAQAVFSAQKENLENMEYERNETDYYNCAVVCDEDPTNPQTTIVDLSNGEAKRTIYLAASNVYEDTENPPLYVAVGRSGYIGTSSDGIVYTQQTSGTTQNLWSVDYQNGRFIVGVNDGSILVSTDAITWTRYVTGETKAIEGVNYIDGVYVAYSATTPASDATIRYSYDASTWILAHSGTNKTVNSVVVDDKIICYNALYSNVYVLKSDDGTNFEQSLIDTIPSATMSRLLRTNFGNGIIVSVGFIDTSVTKYPFVVRSNDSGETNTVGILSSFTGEEFVDASFGLGLFVAIGNNFIAWSSDGETWTECTPATSIDYVSITFDGTLFYAYGYTDRKVAVSADGKNWTVQSITGVTQNLDAVIYGAAQRQYSLYSIGYNALQNYKMVELINGDLLPTARPMIGVDCNVGDVVDIVDKERGIIVSKILTEAQTVYERDKNGIIYPNFGDGYLDLKKYIKKEVDKRG